MQRDAGARGNLGRHPAITSTHRRESVLFTPLLFRESRRAGLVRDAAAVEPLPPAGANAPMLEPQRCCNCLRGVDRDVAAEVNV